MATDGAFRTCPHCGTRNRHYMLVCTRCARSLKSVPLVGTPPPGSVVRVGSGRGRRATVVVLGLLVGMAVAVMLSRALRSAPLEGEVAASSRAEGEEPMVPAEAPDPGEWETLEERFAQLRPPPTAASMPPESPESPTPSAPASAPAAVQATPPPALAPVALAPALPTPAPTAASADPAAEPESAEPESAEPETVERPAPVRPRPTPRADPARELTDEVRGGLARPTPDDDPGRVRSERRAALRRAEERLRALERRAEDLRDQTHDVSADPQDREQWARELAKVLRELEEAERQVVRAEWKLRVEP